ncbi:PRC-barrel domain-containing protein [Cellulosimicrobium sp. CpK407]|uniref:PRC-barrel domain-containing protein n=1 Tax=Cellulosimicrobium sp. CpK407 TaxID=3229847 RepID=UPI003F3D6F02
MISTDQIERLLSGGTVVSQAGEKVGKVGQVFLDDRTGEPAWVTVKTGLFGTAESFVPLADADVQGDVVRVPYTKDTVKDAPRVDDSEGHLSHEEETELYRYYGRGSTPDDAPSGREAGTSEHDREGESAEAGVGRHAAGPPGDDAPLGSGGRRSDPGAGPEGTYRLRRYVVTEYVAETVPADELPQPPQSPGEGAGSESSPGRNPREERRS